MIIIPSLVLHQREFAARLLFFGPFSGNHIQELGTSGRRLPF